MAVYKDAAKKTWFADIRFRDESGKVRSIKKRGFETKRDAQSWEKDFRIERGEINQRYTFINMAERYFSSRKGYANENTIQQKKARLRNYASELLNEDLPIPAKKLQKWRETLPNFGIATRTMNSTIDIVRAIINYGYVDYDIKDTAKSLKRFKLTFEDKTEATVINPQQFDQLLSFIENDTLRKYFEFSYYLGTRRAETRAVLKSDIDMINKTVTISKSLPHGAIRSVDGLSNLKTPKSHRILKMDDELFDSLKPLLKTEGPFLFGGYEPLADTSITRHFERAVSMYGGPRITIHQLRHSNGSLLLDADVPLITVSRRLGHSSIDITSKVYAHALRNIDQKSADAINSIRKK
ncbi:MAG: hypothetical protein FD179_978 [Erysipelotrichaceae bacterium]|nr:MAG: hypothetical protein FD179_978 [Erysipelotrichaceae bacterium]